MVSISSEYRVLGFLFGKIILPILVGKAWRSNELSQGIVVFVYNCSTYKAKAEGSQI